jgi:magnesium transporter
VEGCQRFKNNDHNTWINVDGLSKKDVESLASQFGIHSLLVEDILSINQRPKMDEVEGVLFCVLNMLYFNKQNKTVETEQISIVLGKGFVISFQEDPTRDVFDPIRHKLRTQGSNIRQRKSRLSFIFND